MRPLAIVSLTPLLNYPPGVEHRDRPVLIQTFIEEFAVKAFESDLEQAPFGSDRSSLAAARPVLREIQSDTCFYCQGALRNIGEADHFIPWARYPRHLGKNFVLAHKSCNGEKRDLLAAVFHLADWRERNVKHSVVLKNELGDHFVCDEATMLRVP